MPSAEYRLWEEDLEREERKERQGSLGEIDDDDGFYDDFVIVEKLDMKKYNKQSKLLEEEKIKDSGQSKCLVSRVGGKGKNYTLEDFQIKKVIDKGSFGKVFLVVNKHNGQMYAMKRINKDILIDKNQIQNTKNEKEILF
jgi:serine/threonine protein kinase